MTDEARLMQALWELAYRVGTVALSTPGTHGTYYSVTVGRHSFTAGEPEGLLPALEEWLSVLRFDPAANCPDHEDAELFERDGNTWARIRPEEES